MVNLIITTWIQRDWRGNPLLHIQGSISELHKTWERKKRGYSHKSDFYSISKISAKCCTSYRAVQQARKQAKPEAQLTDTDTKFIVFYCYWSSDLIFVLLWEAGLARWKVNMVWTFAFLSFHYMKVTYISSFLENLLKQECYSTASLFPRGTALLRQNMCRVLFPRLVNGT